MKKMFVVILLTLFSKSIYAQSLEDGFNLSIPNSIVTPRAGALGVAYHGIADDFAAIAYNPAGLALIDKGEISFGLGLIFIKTQSEFMSNINDMNTTGAYLSNFGIIAPFKTSLGNASIGIGYFTESNFDNTMEFGGMNPTSTYVDYEANQAWDNGWGLNENFATYLWLADDDYLTPIKNGLYQSALISEKGGLKNISGAFALELGKVLSLGLTINAKTGNYEYNRDYTETDINHLYEVDDREFIDEKWIIRDINFQSLNVYESIDQEISGVNGVLGIQFKISNFMRIGTSLKFPTYYNINEKFTQSATFRRDNNLEVLDTTYRFKNSYSFSTPWVIGGGLSFNFKGLTITTGIEYMDLTQMEFDGDDIVQLNTLIKRELANSLKYGAGFEWEMPWLPMALRGSFDYTTPPYLKSFSGEEKLRYGFGAGIYLAPNLRMDLMGSYSSYKKLWYIYGNSPETELYFTKNPLDIGLQLVYRY